jgi:hypothetical protein
VQAEAEVLLQLQRVLLREQAELRAEQQAVLPAGEQVLRELQQAGVQAVQQVLRMPFRIRRRKLLHRDFLYRNWDKTCFVSFPRARKPDKHDRFVVLIVTQVFIYKKYPLNPFWQI